MGAVLPIRPISTSCLNRDPTERCDILNPFDNKLLPSHAREALSEPVGVGVEIGRTPRLRDDHVAGVIQDTRAIFCDGSRLFPATTAIWEDLNRAISA